MRHHESRKPVWRSGIGRFLVGVLIVSMTISLASAQREAFPEPSKHGQDPYKAQVEQQKLHDWLVSELPKGVLDSPIRVMVTQADMDEVDRVDAANPGPTTVGLTKPLSRRVDFSRARANGRVRSFDDGMISPTADGGFVWAVALTSEGASALRVHLKNLRLPSTADLYVYNERGQAFGPYTAANIEGDLWTTTVLGSTVILQLRQYGPATTGELRSTGFHISDVGHIGPKFELVSPTEKRVCPYNAPCTENAECYGTSDWSAINDARKAVGLMLWISGAFINTCSGGLVADTDSGSEIPYFLTANHCVSRGKDARSIDFFFDYTKPCTSGSCPPEWTGGGLQVGGGANIRATGSTGDYTLLEMKNSPPAGRVYMGWTTADVANANGTALYRISHPATAPQAFSRHTVDTSAGTCQGIARGNWIYSRDNDGSTEGGSSGSIVCNDSGQIVGQLTGSCGFNPGDPCDDQSNATIDGAFASYFDSVKQYLDPGTSCDPSPEVCDDGSDNDCDGAIDCADSGCNGDPACDGGGCTLGQIGDPCNSNSDCCSNKCRGRSGRKTCR